MLEFLKKLGKGAVIAGTLTTAIPAEAKDMHPVPKVEQTKNFIPGTNIRKSDEEMAREEAGYKGQVINPKISDEDKARLAEIAGGKAPEEVLSEPKK